MRYKGIVILSLFIITLTFVWTNSSSFAEEPKFASDELRDLYYSEKGKVIYLVDKNGVITSVSVIKSNQRNKMVYDRASGKYYVAKNHRIRVIARDDSKVDKIEVSIDGGSNTTYEGNKTKYFSVGEEGEHEVRFKAIDDSGNTEKEQSFKVAVDSTGPEISFPESDDKNIIKVLCIDTEAGLDRIEYRVKDTDEWILYTDGIPVSALKGSDTVTVRAFDLLDNSTTATHSISRTTVTNKGETDNNPPRSMVDLSNTKIIDKGPESNSDKPIRKTEPKDPAEKEDE
ncbi:MAG: hypothetical protein IEMM0008_1468 [bacterium]|nr:MAG: hypothetical protein IEMM0008_1468 [bacterium]